MTRDYSKLGLGGGLTPKLLSPIQRLGWQAFFARQTDVEALEATPPVRVLEVHRSGHHVVGDGIDEMIPPRPDATVGDWLLLNREAPLESEVLERKSVMKRRAPGRDTQEQLIAANIDTAFIVTSCNADFNVARIERYLALAFEAEVEPVIVLTKADIAENAQRYVEEAQAISESVRVLALNAKSDEPAAKLGEWCKAGKTVAFLGSSGVGKSTLTNALAGDEKIVTQAIREDDAKGRHTTTRRQLHFLPSGCGVLDTPGMRELQLMDAAEGVGSVFADLEELASQCRFRDCAHDTEPGCAIKSAVEAGDMDAARLERWKKLIEEDATNTASRLEREAKLKGISKAVKQVKAMKPRYK